MKRYFKGMIFAETLNNGTEKAFRLEIDDGRWSGNRNETVWVPKSICIISEANEVGWCKILIPQWFFTRNRIDYHRIRGMQIGISGEGLSEER